MRNGYRINLAAFKTIEQAKVMFTGSPRGASRYIDRRVKEDEHRRGAEARKTAAEAKRARRRAKNLTLTSLAGG